MSDSDNPRDSQAFCPRRTFLSAICPGMELEPPLCGDAIAWQLILLGKDCGRSLDEIVSWLLALRDVPFWPDLETIAVLLQDAGL